jgi:hypothetical protein
VVPAAISVGVAGCQAPHAVGSVPCEPGVSCPCEGASCDLSGQVGSVDMAHADLAESD